MNQHSSKKILNLLLTALVCASASANPSLSYASSRRQPASHAETASSHRVAIAQLVAYYAKYHRLNGAILVSEHDRVIVRGAAGMANFEWSLPATPETRFVLASVTKQFTAAAILRLADRGQLNLQDTIAKYLPSYREDVANQVTIYQLLTHTSGIPDYVSREFVEHHSQEHYEVSDFIQKYCSGDLLFAPGSQYRYSNAGYFLLGAIIERVTGKPYEAAMRELVFAPLHMDSSGYANNRTLISKRAGGYRALLNGYENATYTDMSIPFAAGALYSTVDDIYKWDQGLNSDTFLSSASRRSMFTPNLDNYALGWRTDPLPVGSTTETVQAEHHGGNIPGFDTTVIRLPAQHDMIVILDNASQRHEIDELSRRIIGVLLDKPYGALRPPIGEFMRQDILQFGIAKAVELYRARRARESQAFDFGEGELNALGYRLLEAGRIREAVTVMQLNTEAFPNSSNAYDSLGEAYLANHQVPEARAAYKRCLALDPHSENARAVLAKVAH